MERAGAPGAPGAATGVSPAFGARSAIQKDHLYWFGTRGLIFTSPWVVTADTERQTAVILLSASGRPMQLEVAGRASWHRAFAIAPLTRRGLRAIDIGLISVNVQPHHPGFAAFARIGRPGVRPLPRAVFAPFDADLVRAYEGRLSQREAEVVFEDLVEAALEALALAGVVSRDERADFLRALLRENPECSLSEIAHRLNVTYTAASHLFARSVGLPLRTYQHWIKCMRATQHLGGEIPLTEIAQLAGFTDSAHLSRTWQRRFGLPPSYLRDERHVRIIARARRSGECLRRALPHVCVVTAGAAVMVLELVGSRVLAPWFGGTTIIWTALIGVIMASLALGYWWGGRLADRHPDYRLLTALFMAAGTSVAALAFGKEAVLAFVSAHVPDLRLGATLATLALFALPSFLLAAIGPFVIRVEIRQVERAGATIGRLNAASTAGSIAGTFLAGFVLIASVGHFRILLGLAATLLLVAALCYLAAPWRPLRELLLLLVAGAAVIQAGPAPRIDRIVHDLDSRYARILIAENVHAATGRPVRGVFIDIYGAQSAVFLDGDGGIVLDYQRAMRLVHHFRPSPRSLLVLGGGVGAVARDFLARAPAGRVDLVEIDPAFTDLGRRYFGLRDDPRLAIFHQDARTFVRQSRSIHDAVVIDVFSTLGTIPYQLTTEEFVADLSKRVAAGGVVLMNVVSAITGERAWFLRAEAATYAKHFPQVEVLQLDPSIDPALTQNLLLVAVASARPLRFDSPDPELAGFLRGRWTRRLEPFPTLTDDFAPVDYYYAKAVF